MKIYCPKHHQVTLRRLFFHAMDMKLWKKKKIKRGTTVETDYFYCPKCDRTYRIKVTMK